MKKEIALAFPLALLCALAVALAAQPDSFVMYFAAPPGTETFRHYCSYFDLLPVGYANYAPMITGLTATALMCLCFLIWIRENNKLYVAVRNVGVVALVSSLMPLLMGNLTAVSWIITGILLVVTLAAFFVCIKTKN